MKFNFWRHIGFNWPTFAVLMALTAIAGSLSPLYTAVGTDNAFHSAWVCALQGSALCALFLTLSLLLLGGFLYALFIRKEGSHGEK